MPNGDINELVERAVGGPAIEESIVLNELESVFAEELQALLDIDREDTSRQEDIEYYAQLLEALTQSDPSVRDTTLQRIEKYKERLTEFKSYLEVLAEFPGAALRPSGRVIGHHAVGRPGRRIQATIQREPRTAMGKAIRCPECGEAI